MVDEGTPYVRSIQNKHGADDDIGEAVAVHVARSSHGLAESAEGLIGFGGPGRGRHKGIDG